jgi:hypothetical protein
MMRVNSHINITIPIAIMMTIAIVMTVIRCVVMVTISVTVDNPITNEKYADYCGDSNDKSQQGVTVVVFQGIPPVFLDTNIYAPHYNSLEEQNMSCEFRLKPIWTIELYDRHTSDVVVPRGPVKITSKPTYSVDTTHITDLNGRSYQIPGKATWADFVFSYVDYENNDGAYFMMEYAARWFNDINTNYQRPNIPEVNGLLRCWHRQGQGQPTSSEWGWLRETWDMDGVILASINFGCGYSTSDEVEYEITLKYQRVDFEMTPEYLTVPAEGLVPKMMAV